MDERAKIGRWGEDLAAAVLEIRGWKIVDRNWRPDPRETSVRGELDIVASDRGRLVICEVKTRSSLEFGHPFEAIGPAKTQKLCLLGNLWARETGIYPGGLRVDAVSVVGGPRCFSLEHREGVI